MADQTFSEVQLAAVDQLSEALKQCQSLNIHIAGISAYLVTIFEDADGREYAAIS